MVTRAVALVDASPLHLEFAFYRVVEWLPPWWCVGALDGWNDHFRNAQIRRPARRRLCWRRRFFVSRRRLVASSVVVVVAASLRR